MVIATVWRLHLAAENRALDCPCSRQEVDDESLFDDNMMADVKSDATKMGDTIGDSLDDGWVHMKVVGKLIADSKTPERTINVDVATTSSHCAEPWRPRRFGRKRKVSRRASTA